MTRLYFANPIKEIAMDEQPTGIKKEVSDEQIEEIAKAFHEIYFHIFWDESVTAGRVNRGYDLERDSWENFNSMHKDALRSTIKELVDKKLISIGG